MARRVFFSFHYEQDIWRACQIRNSWVTQPDRETAGFWDAASWEKVQREGEEAVKRWINNQLNGTSVTVVLIGAETASRMYVNYEIERSYQIGNGLLGVFVHNQKDQSGRTSLQGRNPFDNWHITENNQWKYFSSLYKTYDWVYDNGYQNMAAWIEEAARKAGK